MEKLISESTWQEMREKYGHCDPRQFVRDDKDALTKEAMAGGTDLFLVMTVPLLTNNLLSQVWWQAHRPAMLEIRQMFWDKLEHTFWCEASEWEMDQ
jgi:hypothetical protein